MTFRVDGIFVGNVCFAMVTLPLELLIRLSVVQGNLAVVNPGYKQEAVHK